MQYGHGMMYSDMKMMRTGGMIDALEYDTERMALEIGEMM